MWLYIRGVVKLKCYSHRTLKPSAEVLQFFCNSRRDEPPRTFTVRKVYRNAEVLENCSATTDGFEVW